MKRKKRWWGIWARGAVTAFSLFVALDTFIIPASYSSVKASDSTLFSELESRQLQKAQPQQPQRAQLRQLQKARP
ncbi:hypothetical protein [Porcincola intestinalis]|uniref:hypothetical protein n=1 Tax=Porcincola intestinalis TaxID=2606632 RepID=UPI002A8214C4|nr:hypothetical protein [Porcincola intestinalis]MDY4204127.1 hypothetical protein [Porcincola intestinalis]